MIKDHKELHNKKLKLRETRTLVISSSFSVKLNSGFGSSYSDLSLVCADHELWLFHTRDLVY